MTALLILVSFLLPVYGLLVLIAGKAGQDSGIKPFHPVALWLLTVAGALLFTFGCNQLSGTIGGCVFIAVVALVVPVVFRLVLQNRQHVIAMGFLKNPLSTFILRCSGKAFEPRRQRSDWEQAVKEVTEKQTDAEEKALISGIIRLGSTEVWDIMKPRTDIAGVEASIGFDELKIRIRSQRYSRLPVYQKQLDRIKGVLYIKDLIPHLDHAGDFAWQHQIQRPFFVPGMKPIDALLDEFRERRTHLALVADEYGSVSGLVTLEDVLEEVLGEINDEQDEDVWIYSRPGPDTFIFDGKTLINDFVRIAGLPLDVFDSLDMENTSLGGLLTETAGCVPAAGSQYELQGLRFTVEASDGRRVISVKVETKPEEKHDAPTEA
ncbi:MAG: hemolysin family protein [Bacteroidota bacterium]|jgi:putative hemolysin